MSINSLKELSREETAAILHPLPVGVINGFMVSYAQWGYQSVNPNGSLLPFNPATVRYQDRLARYLPNGNRATINFLANCIEVTTMDTFGRIIQDDYVPYPELS